MNRRARWSRRQPRHFPKALGGERNWDYRYTWLRDSSLMLYALLTIGYEEEAADFIHWLEQTLGSDPTPDGPQIMYGIDGRRELPEQVARTPGGLPWLAAGADWQRRRETSVNSTSTARCCARRRCTTSRTAIPHREPPSPPSRRSVGSAAPAGRSGRRALGLSPGSGIWEVRGGPQPFLYGKLMCWAALDSGLRLARASGLEAPLDRWLNARDEIRQAILERGYNRDAGRIHPGLWQLDAGRERLVIPRLASSRQRTHGSCPRSSRSGTI